MKKTMKRKVTIGDTSKTSQGDTTPPRRPSVFERLGPGSTGLPASDTHGTSYSEKCRNWLRTGNCEYGRSCKYQHGPFSSPNKKSKGDKQSSRVEENESGNKDRKKKGNIRNNPPKLISPANKKNRRRSKTRIHKPEPESKIKSTVVVTRPTDKERDEDDSKGKKWSNDKSHLDFQEELDLEKRRQQLQRELALEMQKERMLQEREKVIIQKTVSSSSSSSGSSSSSRSSSSSSSSDDNNRLNSSSSDDSTDSNAKHKSKRERLKSGARRFPSGSKEEQSDKSGSGKKLKEKSEHFIGNKNKNQSRRVSRSPVTISPKSKGPRTPSPPPKHRHRSPDTGEKERVATGKNVDKYNRKKRSSSIPNEESHKPTKRWSKSPPTPETRRSLSPAPGRESGLGRKSRRGNRTPSPSSMKKIKKKSLSPDKNRKLSGNEKGEKKRRSVSKEKEITSGRDVRSIRSYSPDRDHERHHHTHRSLSPREDMKKSEGFREEKDKKRRIPLREGPYKKGRERREINSGKRGNKNQDHREQQQQHNVQARERDLGDSDRKRNVVEEGSRRSSPFRRGAGSPTRHPASVERDASRRRPDRERDDKAASATHREERRDDNSRIKRHHEKELVDDEGRGYQRDKGRQDGGQESWDWNRGHNKSGAGHEGRRSTSRERRVDEGHRDHRRGFDERAPKDDVRREREQSGGSQILPRGERRHKERVRENVEKMEGRRRMNIGKGQQIGVKEGGVGVGNEKGRRRRRSGWEGRRGRGKGNRSARRAALRAENANLQPVNKQEPQWKRRDEPIEPRKRPRPVDRLPVSDRLPIGDRLPSPPAKHSRNDPSPSVRGPVWSEPPVEEQRELPHRERETQVQDWNIERKRVRENEKPEDDIPKDEGYRRRESRKRRRSRSKDDKRDEKRVRRDPSQEPSFPKTSEETPVKVKEEIVDEVKVELTPGPTTTTDDPGLSDWSDDGDEILNREEEIEIKDSVVIKEEKEWPEEKPERKELLELIEESQNKRRSSSQEKDGRPSRTRERQNYRSQPTSRSTSIERRSAEKVVSTGSRSRSIDRNIAPVQIKEEEVSQLSDESASRIEATRGKETEVILDNDDYEAISDDDLETMIEEPEEENAKLERDTKNGTVDALEIDWSCLPAHPKTKSEVTPVSALRRFSAVHILSRIGVLPEYGGKHLLDKIKDKCEEQLREEEAERKNRLKTDMEETNDSSPTPKLQLTFESSYSNSILFAKIKDSEQKNSFLSDIGSYRRALCAKRDLQMRKQLYKVTEKIPSVTPQSFDNEMYKLSVQLFRQKKVEQENITFVK